MIYPHNPTRQEIMNPVLEIMVERQRKVTLLLEEIVEHLSKDRRGVQNSINRDSELFKDIEQALKSLKG